MTKHKQKEAAEVEKKENPQNHKNEVAAEEKKDASKRRKEVAANEKVQDMRNKVTQSVREEVAKEKTDGYGIVLQGQNPARSRVLTGF